MTADLETFWDRVHRDGHDLWLSDTPPETYIKDLQLDLSMPQRVLEIGVGRGLMVKYLLEHGHDVTACDISRAALDNLPDGTPTVPVEELPALPNNSHDLGISYLALQHMDDSMVRYIVIQAVWICGAFRFQMASMIDPEKGIAGYDGPMFMREPRELETTGITFTELGRQDHPQQNIRWHFMEAK